MNPAPSEPTPIAPPHRTLLLTVTGLGGLGLALWFGGIQEPDLAATIPSDLARTARELRVRESLYARSVGRAASKWAPGLAGRFPRLLGVFPSASLRRLEACHALAAMGKAASPALPLLVEAFCDREHEVRAYAFMALVHVQAPAERVTALLRGRESVEVQLNHCARLLSDEDELVRDYAWALLDRGIGAGLATDGGVQDLAKLLEALPHEGQDAEVGRRIRSLLSRLQPGGRSQKEGS